MENKEEQKKNKIHECNCEKKENEILDEECTCTDKCNCNEEEILILKNNIENLENKVKLAQAEVINYKRRKDEETSNMLKFANMDLILELLPVIDNFERALSMKTDTKDFDKYNEGYKLIYNHIVETLKKFGVEEIEAQDKEFDPNLHEAVMTGSDEDIANDIILEVFNKGYTLKGRVIRPSKVKVNNID